MEWGGEEKWQYDILYFFRVTELILRYVNFHVGFLQRSVFLTREWYFNEHNQPSKFCADISRFTKNIPTLKYFVITVSVFLVYSRDS